MGSIEEFNALSEEEAKSRLHECLASQRWVDRVVSGRPYRDADHLLFISGITIGDLTDDEWLSAMRAHPRIGERGGEAPAASVREQTRVMQASRLTLAELATENRRYEDKFGHVFLIAASGRSAEDILSELRRRIENDPATELGEARRELVKIVDLRIEKLLTG